MADSCIAFAGTAGADKQARGKADAPAGTRDKGWIALVPAGHFVIDIILVDFVNEWIFYLTS